MKFDPSVEKKNPMFYFVVSFLLGMVIGGAGWALNESTKMSHAKWGVPVIVVGCLMIAVGLIGMFFYKKKAKRS
jgi:hypothetical protein